MNIQLNIVTCPTHPDKFIREMLVHRLCNFRLLLYCLHSLQWIQKQALQFQTFKMKSGRSRANWIKSLVGRDLVRMGLSWEDAEYAVSTDIVLGIEVSVPQACMCRTACHHTYDKTWTSSVSSINWKHFCLGVSQPRRIVTVCYSAP